MIKGKVITTDATKGASPKRRSNRRIWLRSFMEGKGDSRARRCSLGHVDPITA
jgi:hypothetical protein